MSLEDTIIQQALKLLESRLRTAVVKISSPEVVTQYLTHKLALEEREIFGVIWLDVNLGVVACEEMFFGTLTQAAVYPREVVKSALKHNAASAIIFHNHPSGSLEASRADKDLTAKLKQTLELIDVRLLDHFIVAGTKTMSFAQSGQL
ncbi:DNA repair protein RadC (plasmid) [Collimonas arenae]|uniref:DNA repair protein RadC n=1 Tax=Collimonas arenae TaxID=279058 RepID=A0A0A1FKI1_9BURK|nr:JAB domain-containing protein [Collimonas arenae]AIY44220.1 DNA repair protein RadC [Collimonas arenae]